MNTPNSPISDEMLSAYLDGELTPEEREQVSAALREHESLRSLLADLQRIRLEIQQLPTYALAPDFASRVTQATGAATHEPLHIKPHQPSSRPKLIMGLAALAATVLVAIYVAIPDRSPRPVADARQLQAEPSDRMADAVATEAGDQQQSGEREKTDEMRTFREEVAEARDGTADLGIQGDPNPVSGHTRFGAERGGITEEAEAIMEPLANRDYAASPGRDADNAPDAIVRASVPAEMEFDSRWSQPQPVEFLAVESSDNERTDNAYAFSVPEATVKMKARVIEGTREQIAAAFRALKSKPTSITVLRPDTDAESMGLPVAATGATGAASSRAIQLRQVPQSPVLSAAGGDQQSGQNAADRFPKLGQAQQPSETMKRFSNQPTSVAQSQLKRNALADSESVQPRYRVLLVIEPSTSTSPSVAPRE